tara:strand:- start:1585 stop:1857 length:273 start_codon:yes stop_codon:yes gene_type:complete
VLFEDGHNRVPVMCKKNGARREHRYAVPRELTPPQFLFVLRRRHPVTGGIFLYVNGVIPASTATFGELHNQHRDKDGCLHVTYAEENVFG